MKEQHADLILLDIMLPGEDGYSILDKLKKSSGTRDIPVIMVTAKEAEFDKVRALESGAENVPTFQNVEIGGGRITGTEVTAEHPEGISFGM